MKILTITCHDVYNFGASLQAYALQHYLEELGHEVEIIDYRPGYLYKKYDWKKEYNPIRRTAKRILSGDPLKDGRPLSDLIELDKHSRKCLEFEATLTDQQIEMLQELGYLPSPNDNE